MDGVRVPPAAGRALRARVSAEATPRSWPGPAPGLRWLRAPGPEGSADRGEHNPTQSSPVQSSPARVQPSPQPESLVLVPGAHGTGGRDGRSSRGGGDIAVPSRTSPGWGAAAGCLNDGPSGCAREEPGALLKCFYSQEVEVMLLSILCNKSQV